MKESNQTLEPLRILRAELAADALPPLFAKLYSQYTRLKMNQPGLKGWRVDEFSERLADAVALIDAGLSEREVGGEGWREALKRAGELLEWLSHPKLNTEQLPLRLLAAGSYQLAGYPALSTGLLRAQPESTTESQILISLLTADFPKLFQVMENYWDAELPKRYDHKGTFRQFNVSSVSSRLVDETVKALGILCAYMRWGEEERLGLAKKKLRQLSEVMIYGADSFSWLLSEIVSEVVEEYATMSMRVYTGKLRDGLSGQGKQALERYLRSNYQARKSLAWHSQIRGIERLVQDGSFVLCTPTGSGKTMIAELAIIQSMFQKEIEDVFLSVEPIVIYLVPSRALATEVEFKLGNVLGNLSSHSVRVTGLYGGVDWGPTDAWVASTGPTVLICTYEKAEALIRFLGPLFLKRVCLVVIDEAHSVQYDGRSWEALRNADDRSLRLELLADRLLRYVGEKRIIALSAVADESPSLAHWVSGNDTSLPVVSDYRSTRQLIGRLEWAPSGEYKILYDILNGHDLGFGEEDSVEDVPYIQRPFAPFPVPYTSISKKFTNKKSKVSKRQRPYLFWAAMQLAQPDEQGNQHSVLISITQHVSGYAEDFLYVLNETLARVQLPPFFVKPSDPAHQMLLNKCLSACMDYFGKDSYEYQLLQRGVVVHHGNMPGLLARLMVELLQQQVVYVALATSTLSEGVNLPFETVIIPTLLRSGERMPVTEFKNLVGRTGRPGWGTEGRALVFLDSQSRENSSHAAGNYKSLIAMMKEQLPNERNAPLSPLGVLMQYIWQEWGGVTGSTSSEKFVEWLEKTAPMEDDKSSTSGPAEEALDSLDGFLLSVIVEQQAMSDEQLTKEALEDYLIDIWRRTYAHYVMKDAELWQRAFSKRGCAVRESIYPESDTRRRLYRTSVAPRFGKKILNGYQSVKQHLVTGINYSEWPTDHRIRYIAETVKQVGHLGKFKVQDTLGSAKNAPTWQEILTWWMNPLGATKVPAKNQVSKWVKFVKKEFEYKFNWGLGTILALILDDESVGSSQENRIEDWPKLGLPWVVFWLKEIITWGTLEPVAAMLLARGIEYTRPAAEKRARDYYAANTALSADEALNANWIKVWIERITDKNPTASPDPVPQSINVSLSRDFTKAKVHKWRVVPILKEQSITWIDPAGYELAICEQPSWWGHDGLEETYDFELDTDAKRVRVSKFL